MSSPQRKAFTNYLLAEQARRLRARALAREAASPIPYPVCVEHDLGDRFMTIGNYYLERGNRR